MVEVKVDMKDKHHAEITFVGEDLSMVQAIRKVLIESDDVSFAGVILEHPEVGHPTLVVKTKKGNPATLVAKAAGKVAKEAESLAKKL
ncbi:DNA-directed RNA polymerase subunit L [uncultured archaeon]|nr:DNA-directed RNA polymerase subunit L [uncultured archaeon]